VPQTFRNRKAVFLWGFMACWMAMLLAFTWLFLRDGAPAGTSPLLMAGVLCLFWFAGISISAWVLGHPLVDVEVRSRGRVQIRKRYLLRVVERQLGQRDSAHAELVETRDSDGDPYFHARLVVGGERALDLWEGTDRAHAMAEVERFNSALRS